MEVNEQTPFPYGTNKGKPLKDLPAWFLLAQYPYLSSSFKAYVDSNRKELESRKANNDRFLAR